MSGISLGTRYGMSNVIIPKGGPKAVPALLDFSNAASIEIDGEQVVANGRIEFIQGVYIDNGSNDVPLTLTMGSTGQRIIAKARTQGYYSILMPNPPKMIAEMDQLNGRQVPVIFYNVPIQSNVWNTQDPA